MIHLKKSVAKIQHSRVWAYSCHDKVQGKKQNSYQLECGKWVKISSFRT